VSDPSDTEDRPEPEQASGAREAERAAGDAPRRPNVTLRRVTIALLFLLLVALVVVVIVLPDLVAERVAERQPPARVQAEPPPPPPPPEDARRLAREKREAGNKLGVVLRMQTELEAEGISTWGGSDYDAALDTLAAGDADLQAGRFASASGHYDEAVAALEALSASRPERLTAALDRGEAGLGAADGPGARDAFETALAIEPHNERAQLGMLRAGVLEEVVALVAAGAGHEARDELEAAREKYAAAMALDAHSEKARNAHAAVTERIRDGEFLSAMSVALTALDGGDFAASREALARADAIKPGTPEVADTRERLELAVQHSRISNHRREATKLEAAERWREAGEHYGAVLAIDPSAAFARAGRERSLAKARIHSELDAYLGSLDRLSAPGPRANAQRLLAAAGEPDAGVEPVLAAKVGKLGRAVEIARTPMQVRLQSDNLTDVAVYKVGRFGRFESRDVLLPPGSYVAVGTRSGYRDVRVEFTLVAGEEPAHVMVRCQEKI
jgi:tetratricopeptide (TPR) repeat protein